MRVSVSRMYASACMRSGLAVATCSGPPYAPTGRRTLAAAGPSLCWSSRPPPTASAPPACLQAGRGQAHAGQGQAHSRPRQLGWQWQERPLWEPCTAAYCLTGRPSWSPRPQCTRERSVLGAAGGRALAVAVGPPCSCGRRCRAGSGAAPAHGVVVVLPALPYVTSNQTSHATRSPLHHRAHAHTPWRADAMPFQPP